MGDKSNIQWTDATWNPVTGCTKVSPGCAHCYAETTADRFWAAQYPHVDQQTRQPVNATSLPSTTEPRQFNDVWTHTDRLDQPLRWKRPRRIFVNSMSDLFHEAVSDEFVDRVFAVMALCPQHVFQVLTKRAERMRDYLGANPGEQAGVRDRVLVAMQRVAGVSVAVTWPLWNVWLGVSVENQHFADERIPLLLQTLAAVRFISAEPLLGPINLRELAHREDWYVDALDTPDLMRRLDWVIIGGDSGPNARPCELDWIRFLRDQCRAAGVPAFVKQLGSHSQHYQSRLFLRDRKGGDPSEWSLDLRVREWPNILKERDV